MARAVVGGLITSTLLTLIVVPVVYTILDDIAAWLFGRRGKQPAAAAVTAVVACAVLFGGVRPVLAQEAGKPAPALRLTAALTAGTQAAQAHRRGRRSGYAAGGARRRQGADARAGARDRRGAEPRHPEGDRVPELGPGQVRRGAGGGAAAGTLHRHVHAALRQQPEQAVRRLHGTRRPSGGGTEHRRDLRRPAGRPRRHVVGDPGGLHLGPGGRGHPGGEARVRRGRPAAAALPAGGGEGRDDGLLRRAPGARGW